MAELIEAGFACAGCGEWNDTLVDPSQGGARNVYVEDCRVCCQPNELTVAVRGDTAEIHAVLEGG